jgi:hypothetical protein
MSIDAREIRCTACGSLLARLECGVLVIQRGDLVARIAGDLSADLTCYRRSCRRQSVVHVVAPTRCHTSTVPPPLIAK